MELWERKLLHDFAVVQSQCQSLGLPEPELIDGSIKHNTKPEIIWRRFSGTEFFALLHEKGHSHAVFENCSCRKEK